MSLNIDVLSLSQILSSYTVSKTAFPSEIPSNIDLKTFTLFVIQIYAIWKNIVCIMRQSRAAK